MKGFGEEFGGPREYILGVTETVWERRGVASLRRFYSEDVVVRSPSGVVVGNGAVMAATLATLAEFGDRQLLGEDVIWCDDGDEGFLSSHRILSTATHSGDGIYGPATRTRLRYRIIADCAARSDQIYDEWLIRDQGAIVRQLGIDAKTFAAGQIDAEGGHDNALQPLRPETDVEGRYRGTGNDHPDSARYAEMYGRVMTGDLAAIRGEYDRAVQLELPGGITDHGWSASDSFWIGLLSSFPSARFAIHHRIGRRDSSRAPRVAMRWSLDGVHAGWGRFGAPSGANVHVMGISHGEYGPDGLAREWVLLDDTAVWKQILLHTG
ncbi:nuclear transport factor 2 family protein [Candidatus Poriferisodalis sp.]|uniref:nuclear transport factor 2 family protein n=1 Tax=Candidatus Poriferisodalis sp. TaxID=3101277 RepID=UPI003B02C426